MVRIKRWNPDAAAADSPGESRDAGAPDAGAGAPPLAGARRVARAPPQLL